MKVKALSRSADTYLPSRSSDIASVPRNLDPDLHPFEKAREYTRALNATKMERMFAQPFIGQLGDGHIDGVYTIAKDPRRLGRVVSGSGDGEIKHWDVGSREQAFSVRAHDGIVKGLAYTPEGNILSCAADKTVKLWDTSSLSKDPMTMYMGPAAFNSISHHRSDPVFATASNVVHLWNHNRSAPVSTLEWGADTINTVAFNQTETSVLASAGTDRTLILYDTRTTSPLQKLTMQLRVNSIAWNPMEAFNFAAASEDHNVYIFDMRKLSRALNVLKDHVAAVLSVDYSPTGQEIVTGSYDRTVRLWNARQGRSRDVYHTKRMQRVFSTIFTMDSSSVLSGSDDGNIRVWRSHASSRQHVLTSRERVAQEYREKLKERYAHMPEIRRIARHRRVPGVVKKAGGIKRVEEEGARRKEENRRKHEANSVGSKERVPERKKALVSREE
ncbi:Protein sof1 [Saitoella coloradoensis]